MVPTSFWITTKTSILSREALGSHPFQGSFLGTLWCYFSPVYPYVQSRGRHILILCRSNKSHSFGLRKKTKAGLGMQELGWHTCSWHFSSPLYINNLIEHPHQTRQERDPWTTTKYQIFLFFVYNEGLLFQNPIMDLWSLQSSPPIDEIYWDDHRIAFASLDCHQNYPPKAQIL